jgi:polyisoprenoid-binding protein YceI
VPYLVLPDHQTWRKYRLKNEICAEPSNLILKRQKLRQERQIKTYKECDMTSTVTQTQTQTVWKIDPTHTLIEFSAKHMMFTTVKGRFSDIEGTITLDEAYPEQSHAEAVIDATTIDTRSEQRDVHLRSADFFDVETFPTISFKTTGVEVLGQERAKVTGDLTIKDVTRPVTLDVTVNGYGQNPWGLEVAGFSAETTINRKDFGLNWNVALEAGGVLVGDTIKITLEIQAVKQS